MKLIAGILSLAGGGGGLIFGMLLLLNGGFAGPNLFISLSLILCSAAIGYYTISTRFWEKGEGKRLSEEKRFLEKEIENEKLRQELKQIKEGKPE